MPTEVVDIRPAHTLDDAHQLLTLIERLAEFEKLTPPDEAARRRFIHDGFERTPPRFQALLATAPGDETPCGYAIFFETYSTFLCQPTLYLEDLFVLPGRRQAGVGTALLRHLTQEALRRDCGRMEWTCLNWNTNAQAFYDKIGAKHLSEWFFYRLDRGAMERFAEEAG